MGTPRQASDKSSEVGLELILSAFGRIGGVIAIFVAAFFLLTVVLLHLIPGRYTISLTVAPVPVSASIANKIGITAIRRGLGLTGGQTNTPLELYLIGYRSKETALALLHDDALMHRIFADEWSSSDQRWHPPHDLLSQIDEFGGYLVGLRPTFWQPPDAARLQTYLENNIYTERYYDTDIINISTIQADPGLGSALLLRLHAIIDGNLRRAAQTRARERIAYYQAQLANVTEYNDRRYLLTALAEEQAALVTSSSSLPFVASPFGSPSVSELPTDPDAPLTLSLAIVVAIFSGAFVSLTGNEDRFRRFFRKLWAMPRRRLGH